MGELTRRDLDVLGHYVRNGNRELYWNYVAHHPGSDGYGLIALGVVRNDNAPGQVANLYADIRAREDGRNMRESDWERFGVDLIRQDFELRRQQQAMAAQPAQSHDEPAPQQEQQRAAARAMA